MLSLQILLCPGVLAGYLRFSSRNKKAFSRRDAENHKKEAIRFH